MQSILEKILDKINDFNDWIFEQIEYDFKVLTNILK